MCNDLTAPCQCTAATLARLWSERGPKHQGPLERSEAATVLDMLVTASMQLSPPDIPALYYVAQTAALLEVRHSLADAVCARTESV